MTTVVFALGYSEVIADVATGFVVLQLRLTLQLLAPEAMVHVGAVGVRVPDITNAWHVLPFQVVPATQLALAVLVASGTPLL